MPKNYKAFTEQEKTDAQARYNQLLREMNKYLPKDKQIQEVDMRVKLAEPGQATIYRMAKELRIKREEQARIADKLNKSQEFNGQKPFPFPSEFKTDGSPESERFNHDIYAEYIRDPDKTIYRHFKKVFDTSAKELCDCENDTKKLIEYYQDHYQECEDAEKMVDIIKNDPHISPDLKKQLPSMEKLINLVSYPKKEAMQYDSIDKIVCPELTSEQAQIIKEKGMLFLERTSEDVIEKIDFYSKETREYSPKEYLDKFDTKPPLTKVDKFITKYSVLKEVNGEKVYHSFDEILENDDLKMVRANKSRATFKLDTVNIGMQKVYQEKWQETFNRKRNYNGKFDLNQIEEAHKGNWFERNILRSTSREYKEMIRALKEYNDPNSKNYLNQKYLRDRTEGYLDHKASQGYGTRKTLTGTSLSRTNLALAIINTLDEHDKIYKQADQQYGSVVQNEPVADKQQAVSAAEVEENAPVNEHEIKEKDNNLIIEEDLDKQMN